MVNVGQQIKEKREQLGWTQIQLAEAAGTNQSTIDRIERGETRNSKHLAQIFLTLGMSETRVNRLPVVGYVGGGQAVLAIDDHILGAGLDEIEAPPGVENGIALIVRGDSMAPRYEDGGTIVIEKTIFDLSSLLGRTCYVKLADGRCYLKTLAVGSRPGRFNLLSSNGNPIVDVSIELAYPVAWVKPRR